MAPRVGEAGADPVANSPSRSAPAPCTTGGVARTPASAWSEGPPSTASAARDAVSSALISGRRDFRRVKVAAPLSSPAPGAAAGASADENSVGGCCVPPIGELRPGGGSASALRLRERFFFLRGRAPPPSGPTVTGTSSPASSSSSSEEPSSAPSSPAADLVAGAAASPGAGARAGTDAGAGALAGAAAGRRPDPSEAPPPSAPAAPAAAAGRPTWRAEEEATGAAAERARTRDSAVAPRMTGDTPPLATLPTSATLPASPASSSAASSGSPPTASSASALAAPAAPPLRLRRRRGPTCALP